MIGAVRFIRINVFDPSIEEENTGSLVSANPAARLPADRQLVYPWIGAELGTASSIGNIRRRTKPNRLVAGIMNNLCT